MAEINVTPFVDVMLVLLIVFMVAAPLLTVGVPVDLPKSEARGLGEDNEPLTLSITKEGEIFLQETKIPRAQLVPRLTAITGANQDARIYVRGDKDVGYGQVMDVMGLINRAGFTRVALDSDGFLMKWSVSISVAAHLALLVLAAGWVRFGDEREPLTPPPIPVDLRADDFSADNIAALLDKAAKDNPPPKKSVKPTTQRRPQRQQTASAPRMTISEVDAIRQAFYRCWSVPAGARDAENLKVEILVSLRPDGSLARAPDLVDKARLNRPGEEFWRAAAESALRAVYQCTPLALPAEKYEAWRKLQLMFDPSEMVGP
ncbi:exbD [Symbiodinium microadriaticum]|nr:exbD [Symbiodinium microadriaticum]